MFPIQWAILWSKPWPTGTHCGSPGSPKVPWDFGNAADGMTDLPQRAVEAGGQDIVQHPREIQQANLQRITKHNMFNDHAQTANGNNMFCKKNIIIHIYI